MYSKIELLQVIQQQLAIENNCKPSDFSEPHHIITTPKTINGRRCFTNGASFFNMVTFGGNVVISADQSVHEWLAAYTKNKAGHQLFEYGNLTQIDHQLNMHGKQLWQSHHMFLPKTNLVDIRHSYPIRWFEQNEIGQFYGNKNFPNAFCEKFTPSRPDVLAVAAYENDEIIGMAGCSADTPLLWQIGIDVLGNQRGKGVGTYLVSLLKNEVLNRGKIPYYGTSLSNLHSWNIALNSGFYPAWVEAGAIDKGSITLAL